MPNITSVTLTAGVPTAGTGTVGTLDNVTGTAGAPSVPVLTVQGVSGGTAQPISGTVTANAGTGTLATSLAALPALTAGAAVIGKVDVQLAGTTPDVGSGTGGTKTQRVIVDSSQLSALGQTTMSVSTPVVIASDQSAVAVGGNVASAASDSGNPVKQGFKASTSLSGLTLVTNAQRTDGYSGVDGVQIVRSYCNLEDIVSGRATDTAGTSTSCIASSGAGVKTYLTSVALTNSSATAVTVNLLDGASVKYTLSVPAGSGNNKEFNVPLPGTAATAWNFQTSAAATTVTCSMIGFKSKV